VNLIKGVSVVIPTYQSPDTLEILVSRILRSVAGLCEVIIVDDGNADGTWVKIQEISSRQNEVKGIRLSRNYGQHSALLAGIRLAQYSTVVTIDDDLQNPPEEIPKLLSQLNSNVDVVYGISSHVSQKFWRRKSSKMTRVFFKTVLGFKSARQMSSFRAFRTILREGFAGDIGPQVSIDALLTWSTTRFAQIEVSHAQREHGVSNYSFKKLFSFMLDTATSFSSRPLRAATSIGFITTFFGLMNLTWVLWRAAFASGSVPGFPFLASSISIFSGVQLIVLGVMGEYLGKMHFRIMSKPTYTVVESTETNTTSQ
jgi:undecaprenyl-phosphate 4-deoxy-4-formamido-L-arabinose transferase